MKASEARKISCNASKIDMTEIYDEITTQAKRGYFAISKETLTEVEETALVKNGFAISRIYDAVQPCIMISWYDKCKF